MKFEDSGSLAVSNYSGQHARAMLPVHRCDETPDVQVHLLDVERTAAGLAN